MPRRKGRVEHRTVTPDAKYNSELVQRLINKVMMCGKKSVAERITYEAFDLIEEKMQKPPLEVYEQAYRTLVPLLEVKSRRVGGANYQVPMEVRNRRKNSLAVKWLVDAARKRGGKSMVENLAGEIMDAYGKAGGAYKKREDVHRMAEANRAYSHFRW